MDEEVLKAARFIVAGETILYPTDTIWGIGCDATNPDAVDRIYRIKQRPDRKSMLVLMKDISMLAGYVEHIPDIAREIIDSAVKPTTIIYPGGRNLAPNLLSEEGTIGIRITRDPFCFQLIEITERPIVSTSANISGKPPADSFMDIDNAILTGVSHVVEWRQEETAPSTPSRIIMLTEEGEMRVIRP